MGVKSELEVDAEGSEDMMGSETGWLVGNE
jgi:hypothetical protein